SCFGGVAGSSLPASLPISDFEISNGSGLRAEVRTADAAGDAKAFAGSALGASSATAGALQRKAFDLCAPWRAAFSAVPRLAERRSLFMRFLYDLLRTQR